MAAKNAKTTGPKTGLERQNAFIESQRRLGLVRLGGYWVTDAAREKLKRLGGSAWLQGVLDLAPEPTPEKGGAKAARKQTA